MTALVVVVVKRTYISPAWSFPADAGAARLSHEIGWQGTTTGTGGSHSDPTGSGLLGFVRRHARLWEFPGHVSKRFLSSFHSKLAVNPSARCQGRGSESMALVWKSTVWLGMKETSIRPLSAVISCPWLWKLMVSEQLVRHSRPPRIFF